MVDQQLDPSIQKFKKFINQYPKLCEGIHAKELNIQSLYEKWSTLGEADPYWNTYKQRENHSFKEPVDEKDSSEMPELVQTLMNATKNMDMAKIQTYIDQMSTAVLSVQEIVQEFNKTPPNSPNEQPKNNYFQSMRD